MSRLANSDSTDSAPLQTRGEGTQIAERVNELFETKLAPNGQRYTIRAVSKASGGRLSEAYLSLLRKGGITHPSAQKVQALAEVFGVESTYLVGKTLPESTLTGAYVDDEVETAVRKALNNRRLREMVLSASEYGPEEIDTIIAMMESNRKLVESRLLAIREGQTSTDRMAETGATHETDPDATHHT